VPIDLTYPDQTVAHHPDGTSGLEVAKSIGPGLAKAAVAVRVNGNLQDLASPITESGSFEVLTLKDPDGLHILRHSSAHVLAQAVLDLYPGSTFAIGPAIEDGFYYDFMVDQPFTPEDLEKIEARMLEIVEADQPFVRESVAPDRAIEIFDGHPFKQEIIANVDPSEVAEGQDVTLYRNDGFVDLCRGPHLPSTGRIPAVKLTKTSGAYWRGDQEREQLQRIYGTAWQSEKELSEYLERLEEAERRDHRKLGAELDLFSFPEELGSGLAVWHPNGGQFRKKVEDHSRAMHAKYGFDYVFTPHLAKSDLWATSGHLDFYAENMYPGMTLDNDQEYRVKPMNCPFHILIYKDSTRSYRDLPIRMSELGGCYRYELSGAVHGLLRARGFTQDDSHTFCTREQLKDELRMHLDFVLNWHRDFGFEDIEADLSTKPEKAGGDDERWAETAAILEEILVESGLKYQVAEGEGAFYGPKIDVHLRDAIGRRWQLSTIQLDFLLPDRFDLEYISAENKPERPYMIHCAKAGSLERFMAVVVEHYAGALPAWLAPVQTTIVPVADRHIDYARSVAAQLAGAGIRVEVDDSGDTVGDKIRKSITRKHPAVIVVGDNDVEEGTVGLRFYGEERDTRGVPVDDALRKISDLAREPAS
jgi:threonyl-tRNA synthetase